MIIYICTFKQIFSWTSRSESLNVKCQFAQVPKITPTGAKPHCYICNSNLPQSQTREGTGLQSGLKVLDHSGVFSTDFSCSSFSMLIHTLLGQMPLLSVTMRQRVGIFNLFLFFIFILVYFETRVGIMGPSHNVSQWTENFIKCCKHINGAEKETCGSTTFCPDCWSS